MQVSNYIGFNPVHFTRIGELLNYICLRNQPYLYSTKLMKLLYIIDEESVIKTGVPITWMKFYIYSKGPLPEKLWLSLRTDNDIFKDYINLEYNQLGYKITANGKWGLGEFSINEKIIIDETLDKFENNKVSYLIDYTHRKGGLWDKLVEEKNIEFVDSDASPYVIDFEELIKNDNVKSLKYKAIQEEVIAMESLFV